MAKPLIAGLAPGIVLTGDYTVNLVALDPTTGSAVSGVTVSQVSMQVDKIASDEQTAQPPPYSSNFTYVQG